MGTILQDMMGMLSRKKVVTPRTDDYITLARYAGAQERMKPHPKVETELVTMGAIKTFVNAGDTVKSLTTTGVSGASTLVGGVLNIPEYANTFTSLTTTGDSGDEATLVAGVLNIPTPSVYPLVWSAQLYQTGTSNPVAQARAVTTLTTSKLEGGTRSVQFTRLGVGQYRARVQYTNSNTIVNSLSIMFGDSICRVTGKQQGSSGGFSYRDWTFETPGFDGVLSDDLLLGNNGGYCTITLYS